MSRSRLHPWEDAGMHTGIGDCGVEGLRVEVRDRVGWVTIDRPERRNALSLAARLALEAICTAVDDDDAVDVLVLAAVGPVFCAGADLIEIRELGDALVSTDPGAALRSVGKPVIAAVGGACVTGGLELALSCDLIVASTAARFRDTHARIGVLPRWGMSALLPRAVGIAKAKEMTLTGAFVDADEALRIGLVSRVVAPAELDATVAALAAEIAACDPRAARASLDLYDESSGMPLAAALRAEQAASIAFMAAGVPLPGPLKGPAAASPSAQSGEPEVTEMGVP
jgi:enoyl-CoA hydratase